MKWYINSCDGIYNSFDVHFTSECDNRCPHCIDAKYGGKGFKRPNAHAIAKTIIEHQEGFDDVLFLGEYPQVVVQSHKALVLRVAHVVEAELDHFREGNVGEQDQQEQRNHGEQKDDQQFLSVDFLPAQIRLHGTDDTHWRRTSLVMSG